MAFWPINVIVMFHAPWPKGAPTVPERFVARDVNGDWTPHAAFGRLTGAQWRRLMHRHCDHHLTQFGA